MEKLYGDLLQQFDVGNKYVGGFDPISEEGCSKMGIFNVVIENGELIHKAIKNHVHIYRDK